MNNESMERLSSDELMAICNDRWRRPGDPAARDESISQYNRFVSAITELARRGPEIRDWCRQLIVNPDYDAREHGAFLLGQLGKRHCLGDSEAAVITELGELTRRPVEEDPKELQAIDAAIGALAEIGNPAAIPFLEAVLFSEDKLLIGDCQWDAAEALGKLVGEPFVNANDRVGAARAWLRSHADEGSSPSDSAK
jgi:hypothetical protein